MRNFDELPGSWNISTELHFKYWEKFFSNNKFDDNKKQLIREIATLSYFIDNIIDKKKSPEEQTNILHSISNLEENPELFDKEAENLRKNVVKKLQEMSILDDFKHLLGELLSTTENLKKITNIDDLWQETIKEGELFAKLILLISEKNEDFSAFIIKNTALANVADSLFDAKDDFKKELQTIPPSLKFYKTGTSILLKGFLKNNVPLKIKIYSLYSVLKIYLNSVRLRRTILKKYPIITKIIYGKNIPDDLNKVIKYNFK